jgi:hypothetical protein
MPDSRMIWVDKNLNLLSDSDWSRKTPRFRLLFGEGNRGSPSTGQPAMDSDDEGAGDGAPALNIKEELALFLQAQKAAAAA